MKRVAARKQPVGGAGKLDAGMTTASVVGVGHTRDMLEDALHAPEAAAGKDRLLEAG